MDTTRSNRHDQADHAVGLDYVSCSPYRVPVARLAAARAALGQGEREMNTV